MATTKIVTVRERDWSIEVPAILHSDGMLEFASGNMRPYEPDFDMIREPELWQVREFWSMR